MSGGGRAGWIYLYWQSPSNAYYDPREHHGAGDFTGIDIKYTKHATATNNIRDGTEYVNNFEIISTNPSETWERYNMKSPEITITAENSSSTTITSGSTTNDSTIILTFTSTEENTPSLGNGPAPFYFPNGSSDITVTNGAISNLAASSENNTGVQEYTATFTPTTSGLCEILVAAYKVEQAQGGAHQELASNTFTWTYDNVIPLIGDLICTSWNSSGSDVTVEFPENVYNTSSGSGYLEASDFTLTITGGTATNPVCQAIAGPIGLAPGNPVTNVWRLTVSYTGTADGTETLTVKDSTGTVVDLSNETITATMRKTHLASSSTSFTTAKVSATDGTCSITLTDTVTSALSEGRYVWDLTTTDSSGLITRRIEGRATVTPSVSR